MKIGRRRIVAAATCLSEQPMRFLTFICAGLTLAGFSPWAAARSDTKGCPSQTTAVQEEGTANNLPSSADGRGTTTMESVFIRTVKVNGALTLAGRAAALTNKYVGQLATVEILTVLAQDISSAYAKSDLAFHQVDVAGLDPETGFVQLNVREGYVTDIVIEGDIAPRWRRRISHMMAPLLKQAPLHRDLYERTLVQISEMPGLQIEAAKRSSDDHGGIQLVITAKRQRPSLILGYNNFGGELVGPNMAEASLQLSGLAMVGAETRIYASAASRVERSRFLAFSHGLPLDRDGTRLTIQAGYLRSKVFYDLLRGKGVQGGITLSRPLLQRFGKSIHANLSLDFMNLDNAILIYRLTDDRTRAIRLSLRYRENAVDHQIDGELGLSQGIDIASARASEGLGKVGFTKIHGRLSVNQMIHPSVVLRLRATGQFSAARLPLVEQMAGGGSDFGRAFSSALISGDDGWSGALEIAWMPQLVRSLSSQELFVFVDNATVHYKRRHPYNGATYRLASVGIGSRLQLGERIGVDFGAAHSVRQPYEGIRDDWRLFMTARMKLKF
jgi:hemolysin activation/secretion protein